MFLDQPPESSQQIVNHAGVLTFDEFGVIVACDTGAARLFGYQKHEILKQPLSLLIPPPFSSRGAHLQDGAIFRIIGKRKQGSVLHAKLEINVVKLAGQSLFVASLSERAANIDLNNDLQHSAAITHAIFETAINPIITIDAKGFIRTFNSAALQLFGYAPSEMSGMNVRQLMPQPYRDEHDGYLQRYLQGGTPRIIGTGREVGAQRKDGTVIPIHLSVGAMSVPGQSMFVGIIVDLTERRAIEQELLQHRDQLTAMVEKATSDLQAIVSRNNNIASRIPGVIYVYQLRPDGSSCFPYTSDAIFDIFGILPESIREDASSAMNLVYADDLELIATSVEISARDLTPWREQFRIYFPDGSLHWVYGDSIPQRAEDGTTTWYGYIADITERKKLEQELRDSEVLNKALFQNSHIPMVVNDPNGAGFVDCNQAAVDIYGYTDRNEVLGKTPLDVSAPFQYDGTPTVDLMAQRDQAAIENQIEIFEWRHRRPNGEIWDAKVHLMHFQHRGKDMLQFTLEDITERKRAETALRASEEKLRGLFELSPLGIALTDMEGHYLEFNQAFVDITGYSESELKDLNSWEMTPAKYAPDHARLFNELKTHGRYSSYEKEYCRKDGTLVPVSINGMFVTGQDGQDYCWSIIEDVTEKKRIAAALQQAMDELNNLIEHIPAGVYKHRVKADGTTQFDFVSPRMCELMEVSMEQAFSDQAMILQRIHPDEISAFLAQINKRQRPDEPFVWEGRTREGMKVRWVHIEAYRTVLPNGDILSNGIAYDITQTKEHEQQLNILANYDSLTGLPNRKLLIDRLQQAVSHAKRNQTSVAVIFLDLDGFKPVNDTHGHAVGDKLLIEIAQRLSGNLRECDTVARIGGDEFVLLLRGLEQMDQYHIALQRILDSINQPVTIDAITVTVSASIGLSQYPCDATDPDILLRLADQSMYSAKQSGKNKYKFYSGD